MRIASTVKFELRGKWIMPGTRNYSWIDHKEPAIAEVLRILRDESKVIQFSELLPCDVKEVPIVRKPKAPNKKPRRKRNSNISKGNLPDKATDESSGRSEVSE